jgi:hypothetical protein
MSRKKKKSNNYYTGVQDVAICAYNKSDNPAQRERYIDDLYTHLL